MNQSTTTKHPALTSKIESQPAVYCGTYGKYNEGSIRGAWIDLTLVKNEEEFYTICRELHQDEQDPEFMFQDWQSIPDRYISESGINSDYFDYLETIANMSETMAEAYECFINDGHDANKFEDAYMGEYDSEQDYAEQLLEETGEINEIPQHLRYYFDYEAYARDLFINEYFMLDGRFVFISNY